MLPVGVQERTFHLFLPEEISNCQWKPGAYPGGRACKAYGPETEGLQHEYNDTDPADHFKYTADHGHEAPVQPLQGIPVKINQGQRNKEAGNRIQILSGIRKYRFCWF